MVTLMSEYALRALICVAQRDDNLPITTKETADQPGIPHRYLSGILRELVRTGVLISWRGKGGGFRMTDPPETIPLYRALETLEPVISNRRPCPFGNEECSDDDPCPGHEQWKKVRNAFHEFLNSTSVHDVAVKPKKSSRSRKKKSK